MNWKLRSGGGKGADQAFERGTRNSEIFRGGSNAPEHIRKIAADHHPRYHYLDRYIQSLFDRNVQIILGLNADDPSACVIYWHEPDNKITNYGGTNHSLRIADTFKIPTFNIEFQDQRDALEEFIYGQK